MMNDYNLERERINRKMDEQRIKEDMARRANREKQATFKENMKRKGYRQKNVWVKDPPEGMVEVPAVHVHKEIVGIADRDGIAGEKLKKAIGNLVFNEKFLTYDQYLDILSLLKPLGKIFQEPSYQGNPGYESENF